MTPTNTILFILAAITVISGMGGIVAGTTNGNRREAMWALSTSIWALIHLLTR
jgi:hypothetical protein